MREFSKVYCSLWQSQKFDKLPDAEAKLLYLYLLTNEHSNSSGCYDLKRGYATIDLKFTDEAFNRSIEALSIALLIEVEKGFNTVLVTNWVTFNEPTNAKHAMGIMSHLERCSSELLKTKRAQEFTEIINRKKLCNDRVSGEALNALCIGLSSGYAKGILTETYTETQTERETRPRLDLDPETVVFSEAPPNGSAATAKGRGGLPSGEEGALKRLLDTPLMRRHQ